MGAHANIVSCFLMGGLGNQLFQIFTTLAYCIRYSKKMVLPYSDFLTVGISRPTYWNSFLQMCKQFTATNPDNMVSNEDLYNLPQYREKNHNYSLIPNIDQNFQLFGYFQSYKYFEMEKDQIFSIINLREQQQAIMKEYSEYFDRNYVSISMHFRLGDYKEKQDYHPILPYEYYENALFNILLYRKFTEPYRVIYFCEKEDIDMVESNIRRLKLKYPHIDFIKVNDSIDDWKQLLIMSCCNNNIIANSSFSWWAGYFNQHADAFVCYPHKWFGPKANHDVSDMLPIELNHIKW